MEGIVAFLLQIDPTFEVRLLTIAGIIAIVLILNGIFLVSRKRFTLGKITKGAKFLQKFYKRKRIFNALALLLILIITAGIFFQRPFVISSTPVVGTTLENEVQSITMEFDVPVDIQEASLYISPEVDGDWDWEEIIPETSLARKVTFTPTQSFYPETTVVVYIAKMRTPWGMGDYHEHALEFTAPEIPNVVSITPEDSSTGVTTDVEMSLYLDAPTGKYIDWGIQFTPAIEEYEVIEKDEEIVIEFNNGLPQDSQYEVEVTRTPRSYNNETGEDIERGDTEVVLASTFATVKTPNASSTHPSGSGVHDDEVIRIVFDHAMVQESVEEAFTIVPSIAGDISWEDDKTLIFTPVDLLSKETTYEVMLPGGVQSIGQGVTGGDIKYSFTTIGKIKVGSTSPKGGSTGIYPNSTDVKIIFDQEVDHQSAQDHFSIYPKVNGSFTWDGNEMTYSTAGKLAYSTKYTVTVGAGVKSIYGLDSTDDTSFTFTTRSQIFTINVPYYKQQESFTCNIAATRMALAYRGVYKSESQIRSSIGTGQNPNSSWVSGYGTHAGPIGGYISNYRSANVRSGMSLSELTAEVKAGNPVIVWVYNRYSTPYGSFSLPGGYTGYKGMHSEVVRGFKGDPSNPTHILTNDPWRGRLTYTKGAFTSIWGYLGNSAVVVK